MTKYRQAVEHMLQEHAELFDRFTPIHEQYKKNPDANREQFNEIGTLVLECIREAERKLCATSEKGQFGKFSSGLSDKFWGEIRHLYPKIDFVGSR